MTHPSTVKLLGHTFKLFTKNDGYAFAGASEPAYICHPDDNTILIWCPTDRRLDEMAADTILDDKNTRYWTLAQNEPLP